MVYRCKLLLCSSFRAFLREVESSLESDAISCLLELAAVLRVLAVIKHCERFKIFLLKLMN